MGTGGRQDQTRSALLDVRSQPQQGILSSHQLGPGFIETLLLALNEASIWGNGLVDSPAGLLQLQINLTGERLLEAGLELGDATLEIALRLAALAGQHIEPAHRQRRCQ